MEDENDNDCEEQKKVIENEKKFEESESKI